METRKIKLSLDKAKEWYKAGGDLREVALQAFQEKELCDVIIRKDGNFIKVKGDGEYFMIYDMPDFYAKWDDALVIAERMGFSLPTRSQLELMWKHRDEINNLLTHPFSDDGWYWSNEQYSANLAWYLAWSSGDTFFSTKTDYSRVRAFSALSL